MKSHESGESWSVFMASSRSVCDAKTHKDQLRPFMVIKWKCEGLFQVTDIETD
jgi:hypothetical protein